MNEILNVSRQTFLKSAAVMGGGLALGFYLPGLKNGSLVIAADSNLIIPEGGQNEIKAE